MLKKEDCRHRAPRDGDVIYSIFTMLMNSVPDGQLTYLLTYLLTTSPHALFATNSTCNVRNTCTVLVMFAGHTGV